MTDLDPYNVHAADRVIPAGKVLTAECGAVDSEPRAYPRQVIARRQCWGGTEVRLEARLAGWAPAGSCLRWDNGCYAVAWDAWDGTSHGRRYASYVDALAHFESLPAARKAEAA
jgi:hypothetical protein